MLTTVHVNKLAPRNWVIYYKLQSWHAEPCRLWDSCAAVLSCPGDSEYSPGRFQKHITVPPGTGDSRGQKRWVHGHWVGQLAGRVLHSLVCHFLLVVGNQLCSFPGNRKSSWHLLKDLTLRYFLCGPRNLELLVVFQRRRLEVPIVNQRLWGRERCKFRL